MHLDTYFASFMVYLFSIRVFWKFRDVEFNGVVTSVQSNSPFSLWIASDNRRRHKDALWPVAGATQAQHTTTPENPSIVVDISLSPLCRDCRRHRHHHRKYSFSTLWLYRNPNEIHTFSKTITVDIFPFHLSSYHTLLYIDLSLSIASCTPSQIQKYHHEIPICIPIHDSGGSCRLLCQSAKIRWVTVQKNVRDNDRGSNHGHLWWEIFPTPANVHGAVVACKTVASQASKS